MLVTVKDLDVDADFSSAPSFRVTTIKGNDQTVCWQDCHVTAMKGASDETERLPDRGQAVLTVGTQLYIMPMEGRAGKVLEK